MKSSQNTKCIRVTPACSVNGRLTITPRSGGTCQNFWTKLIPQKLEGCHYYMVKIARFSRHSTYAVARKNG